MDEVLLLEPTQEGTRVRVASNLAEISALLESGLSMGDVVMSHTSPRNVHQLTLFGD